MTSNPPTFRLRAFTSVLIALAFLALVVSGVVLFIAPPGRVANWSDWRVVGLTKHDWADLHIGFGAVFLIAVILHLVFNFRPLLNYFKGRITRRISFRPEWMAALILCAVVFGGTRANLPPFAALLKLNDRLKHSWETSLPAAPIAHAELLTLGELAETTQVPLATAIQRLTHHGVQGATPEIVVAELATRNQLSAQRIYEIFRAVQDRGDGGRDGYGGGAGGGQGRMTLAEFCESRGLNLQEAQARLAAKGIKAQPEHALRDIAQHHGYDRPRDIMDIVAGTTR